MEEKVNTSKIGVGIALGAGIRAAIGAAIGGYVPHSVGIYVN